MRRERQEGARGRQEEGSRRRREAGGKREGREAGEREVGGRHTYVAEGHGVRAKGSQKNISHERGNPTVRASFSNHHVSKHKKIGYAKNILSHPFFFLFL
jgi:hypothetical protein